jgi:hypothetical protein
VTNAKQRDARPHEVTVRKDAPFLKNMMTGLIYPAVLGTILFVFLQVTVTPIVAAAAASFGWDVAFDPVTKALDWQKDGFLIVMLLFYHCDYFYIAYTKVFTVAFFVADFFFVAAMYVTLVAINPFSAKPVVPALIAFASLVFVILYLAWDVYEHHHATGDDERGFYRFVVAWEILSAVALLGNLFAWPRVLAGRGALLAILAASTVVFGVLVHWKKKFFERWRSATT